MRVDLGDSCMTLGVCARVPFRSVHVAIEMLMHPVPIVLKQVYVAKSLAVEAQGLLMGCKRTVYTVKDMHFSE